MAYEEMLPRDAHPRLAEFLPVDVRGEPEFQGPLGHVRGAKLIPLSELKERAAELPKDRPLLLICRSGKRSGMACEMLGSLGYGPLVNLTGGMIAWNHAELPVEQVDPASLEALLQLAIGWYAQVGALTPDSARTAVLNHLQGSGEEGAVTHRAVDAALDFVTEALSADPPPDLALSIAGFRRSLAVL